MRISLILICLVGLLVDIWFIKTEYAGKLAKATALKGLASAFLCCSVRSAMRKIAPGSGGLF